MKIFKKGLAILLATVMLFTVMPIAAFAENQVAFELVLDQITTVTLNGENSVWLSFTPEVSGYYEFYSANRGELDPQAWLYDSEGNELLYNDDGDSWEFSLTYSLVAGQKYLLEVKARNLAGNFDVGVREREPKVIESIDFEDLFIFESNAYPSEDWNGEQWVEYTKYRYDIIYTVTYSDGSTERRRGESVYDDIGSYWISVTDDQSYETPWSLGTNTATAFIEDLGISETFSVNIVESPVASVVVDKTVYIEKTNGGYRTEWIEDEETGEEIESPEYFHYDITRPSEDNTVITLKDGTVINGNGFEWQGNWYEAGTVWFTQDYENQWTVGNTYELLSEIAGFDFTYEIEIASSPVASVEVEKATLMEGLNGYYETDSIYDEETGDCIGSTPEYFYYHTPWPQEYNTTITLTDGTVINDNNFYWNGEYYRINVNSNQSYENQWTKGNTYEVTGYIAGFDFTYEVEIVGTPVVSVEVEKTTLMEGSNGYYAIDDIYDEETGDYIGNSPEYFYYYTPWPQEYNTTITLTDGTVINDNEFHWNGQYYSINVYSSGQNYENQWTAGNTYEVSAEIAGFDFTYEVEIIGSPVASVEVGKITVMEGNDVRYVTDSLYDEETGEYIGESPEYLYYEGLWPRWDSTIITLTDGTVIEGNEFEWNGGHYSINNVNSNQSYENQWIAGNTYEVSAEIAGFKFTYEVEVKKSPVASVTTNKIIIMEGSNGDYRTDEIWNEQTQQLEYSPEYFYYYLPWPSYDRTVITLTDGTVINGNDFEYDGEHYSMSVYDSGQCYEYQWTAGNTYEMTGVIAGHKFTYEVEIIESPVASVVVQPVRVVENTRGWYSRDSYFNEETGEYIQSPEYFRYDTPWPESVTITLKDGTIINGTSFEFNGEYYSMSVYSIYQNYENQLTVGTHQVQAEIAGHIFTYDMEIVELTVDDVYEYMIVDDGAIITDCFIAPETLEIPAELGGKPVIGVASLSNYGGTKHIVFPDSVRTIGDYVISGLYSLETVTFGAGVENLESYMFQNSYNLTAITVSEENPNFATENGVLYNKNKNTVIAFPVASGNTFNVPDSVTNIDALGDGIYSGIEIVFSSENPNFVTEDGVTYNKDKTKILFCSKNKTGKYVMPDTVVEIAPSAFSGCTELTEVVVSSQVTELVYCVFFSCLSLEKVDLPDGLISIDQSAFEGTTALESIELPEGLEEIGLAAFLRSGLTSLTVPNSVKVIGSDAFMSTNIQTLDLGNGVAKILSGAFAYTLVTSVTLPNSLAYLGASAFAGCNQLVDLTFGSGLSEISDGTFSGTAIKNLNIPKNIRYIGEGAFASSQIESLTLNEGLDWIDYAAFRWCENLTSAVIPDSVTTIGEHAFFGCINLANVVLGDGLEYLGYAAFAESSITNLDLGNSIEVISEYTFAYNDMTAQFFPNSVTTIMYGAFMDCEELTSIELPLSVDTIEYDAFANCSNLTDVYYEGTEEDRNNMNIDPDGNEYLLNATWHYGHVNNKWSNIPENAPTFVVESAEGRIGDTVTVAIKTKNNPGITGLKLYIGYDSNVLEFVSGTKGDFVDGVFNFSPVTNNPISIVWTSTSLMSEDGTVALLEFRIKDDAPVGETGITVSYDKDDVFGEDVNEKIEFYAEDGFVNVISYVSGDVNDDNVINNKDLALLLRFVSDWEVEINELAADVNRDGKVNTVDLGILLRYLSDWDVELK